MLANLDSRHIGLNRLEGPPNVTGGIHLHIESVVVRRSTTEPDQDNRAVNRGWSGIGRSRFEKEVVAQVQTEKSERSDLDEIPPAEHALRHAPTITFCRHKPFPLISPT